MDDDHGRAAVPNHALLVAMVAVQQAGTRTAQIAGRMTQRAASADPVDALVQTFLHADTAAAAGALGGSFHPQVARASGRAARKIAVNSPFTLAF